MKTKAQTCQYNANRHAHKVAHPFCTFAREITLQLPPHMHLANGSAMNITASTCSRCKCHKKAD